MDPHMPSWPLQRGLSELSLGCLWFFCSFLRNSLIFCCLNLTPKLAILPLATGTVYRFELSSSTLALASIQMKALPWAFTPETTVRMVHASSWSLSRKTIQNFGGNRAGTSHWWPLGLTRTVKIIFYFSAVDHIIHRPMGYAGCW